MAKRQVDFISGFETPTAPVVGTPSLDGHLVTKGYADDTYTPRAHVYGKVSNLTALKAIASADRFDEQLVWQAGVDAWYEFDSSGVQTPDDDEVVQPTSGTGRWLKVASGGGGAVGSGSAIDAWKQKYEQEHDDIRTDSLSNSVGESFSNVKPTVTGVLLQDLAAIDTEAYIVWNRGVLDSADADTDSVASNWAVALQGANLTTDTGAGNFKTGTASIEFDKGGSGTIAQLLFDQGAATLSMAGKTELYFWVKMPSVINFTRFEVIIDVDATNLQTYQITTDIEGNAIVADWNFIKVDLTGGTPSGTGWDNSKLFRYFRFNVVADSAQTYTDIYFDSLSFGIQYPERLVQRGSQFTIYNTSTVDNLQVDNASTLVQGLVTLVAATGEAYSGGEQAASASVKRVTLQTLGDNLGYMETGLSGEIADLQTSRISRVLPVALAGNDITSIFDVNTNCHFEVTAVNSSTEIEVDDPVDQSANLVAGKIIHVAAVYYNDEGKPQYVNRELDLTIVSSSHAAGVTTIETGTNTGIAVGDVVILKHLDAELSCVALGADESYSTLTDPVIKIESLGISYPYGGTNSFAHWYLGGVSDTEALRNRIGSGPTLSKTGSPNLGDSFFNGAFSASGWTTGNYLSALGAATQALSWHPDDASLVQLYFSLYYDGTFGTDRYIISRNNTGNSTGWTVFIAASGSAVRVAKFSSGNGPTGGALTVGWNHIGVVHNTSTNATYILTNGVQSASESSSVAKATANLTFGADVANTARPSTGLKIAHPLFLVNGSVLTSGQLDVIRNTNNLGLLGFKPGICYEYESTGQVGQLVTSKGSLSRVTDDAIVAFRKHGAIVTG